MPEDIPGPYLNDGAAELSCLVGLLKTIIFADARPPAITQIHTLPHQEGLQLIYSFCCASLQNATTWKNSARVMGAQILKKKNPWQHCPKPRVH